VARLHSASTGEAAAVCCDLPCSRDGTRLTKIELHPELVDSLACRIYVQTGELGARGRLFRRLACLSTYRAAKRGESSKPFLRRPRGDFYPQRDSWTFVFLTLPLSMVSW